MKNLFKLTWLVLFAMSTLLVSCDDDDDDDNDDPNPVLVEDGIYIMGDAIAVTTYDAKGLMNVARNEVIQENRSTLFEKYIAISSTGGFSIGKVAGAEKTIYGPGADFEVVLEADRDNDEPQVDFWRGSYTATETEFTVPTNGLYHVVIDTEINKVVIVPVTWGVIGGATPGGWSNSTVMPAGDFNLETMTFTATEVEMTNSDWKFRYSDGWKVILDPDFDLGDGNTGVKVNANYGGAVDALVPGGANITNEVAGIYTIEMTWDLEGDNTATLEKTGDLVVPEYPEAMYLVGAGTFYGWDTPGTVDNAIMHKTAGGIEGLFWKILYIEAGEGFKVSAADWGDPNLGFAEVAEFDANGVEVTDNGGNMDIAESGMYMVVLDLREETTKLSVIAPDVYGIGDAFGSWDEDVAENLFTIDNDAKTVTSPALTADGAIRMYVSHEWIPAWWNAEFNVYTTAIEYRNDGGDQEAVNGTAGQVVTLHFDDNTGAIE
ncbi:MAG: SusF/SusE family outer membrane protein [Bacteroidota bacterium]|nr:SusF/SusE family outer membrane protein [Bacteroidota bacterium]